MDKRGACLICGNRDVKYLYVKNKHSVVECRKCDFIFVNSEIDLTNFYEKDYFLSQDEITGYKDYIGNMEKNLEVENKSTGYDCSDSGYTRFVKKFRKNGKLLDIGCATGNFLKKMAEGGGLRGSWSGCIKIYRRIW